MSSNYWMDNAFTPGTHTLIDLGYFNAPNARARAEQLRPFLGVRNFMCVGSGRLVARIPKAKASKVMENFPDVLPATEKPGYCWCTHTWIDAESTDLKYARH